jgi:hypothetical protein
MPRAQIERWRIHGARDHTVGMLARGQTVRCDVWLFKRAGGLELELRLVPLTDSSQECAFTSMAQCLASKHGNVDFCERNNTYIGNTRSFGSRAG